MRLLHLLGPFAVGAQGLVVGKMAEQIKRVGFRLVDQNITVGKVKNARPPMGSSKAEA